MKLQMLAVAAAVALQAILHWIGPFRLASNHNLTKLAE